MKSRSYIFEQVLIPSPCVLLYPDEGFIASRNVYPSLQNEALCFIKNS